MPTVCKIRLDATEYKKDLEDAVSKTGSAANRMAGETRKVGAAVAGVGGQTQTQGLDQLNGKVKKVAEGVGKAGPIVSGLGSAFSAMSPKLSALGGLLQSAIMGPIGWITAGLGLLAAVGVRMWDKLTLSSEEYQAKISAMIADSERAIAKLKEQSDVSFGYLARLREMTKTESMTNSGRMETAKILDLLTTKYGNLGAVVDVTTGKLLNQEEVEKRIRRIESQKRIDELEKQRALRQQEYNAQMVKVGDVRFLGLEKGQWSWANRFGVPNQRSESELVALRNQNAPDDTKFQGYSVAIEKKRQMDEIDKSIKSERETGFPTAEAAAQYELEMKQREQDRRESQRNVWSRDDGFNSQALEDKRKELESLQKTIKGTIWSEGRDSKNIVVLKEQERDILQDIAALEKGREAHYAKMLQQRQGEVEVARLIMAEEYDKAAALKLQLDLEQQKLTLTDSERRKLLEQQQALESLATAGKITQEREEVHLQQLLLAGKYEEYKVAKLLIEARRESKNLTLEERKALLTQREAQASLTLKQSMKDQAIGVLGQAAERVGLGRQFSVDKAVYDAREAKGRAGGGDLTAEEEARVRKLAALSYGIAHPRDPELGDLSVKSNALSSRGGFAGAVVAPERDRVNQTIAENTRQQVDLLREVQRILETIGKV